MQRAHDSDRSSPLTLAVLGAWTLAQSEPDLDKALGLLYGAIDRLGRNRRRQPVPELREPGLRRGVRCAVVAHARSPRHARSRAWPGQRDWITVHMLDTLNEADHGRAPHEVTAFTVTARAEAPSAPEHWPVDAQGYTTGFTVLAADEDEARRYSLEYLRSIEPFPQVQFQIEAVRPGSPEEVSRLQSSMQPRAAGSRACSPGARTSAASGPTGARRSDWWCVARDRRARGCRQSRRGPPGEVPLGGAHPVAREPLPGRERCGRRRAIDPADARRREHDARRRRVADRSSTR